MNSTISLEHIAKTGDLNADLILRQYISDKTTEFMKIESVDPKIEQCEIARELKKIIFYITMV